VVVVAAIALCLERGAYAQPKFKVLATMPNGGLWSGLTLDAKGNLYGVTTGGGDNGVGAVFEMSRNAKGQWTVTTLHSFDGKDGARPNGDLIFDTAGNLYGTTPAGGAAFDGGTVFELTPGSGGWTFSVLYSFCHEYGCPDGGGPQDGLVQDKAGNLLGTAQAGLYDMGVVFELTPGSQGWTYNVLYNFGTLPNDGSRPLDALVLNADGDLYGTTYRGGRGGFGTVFRLSPTGADAWNEQVLHPFCLEGGGCAGGAEPSAGVILVGSSSIYGTTAQGGGATCGETNCGAIFKLTRSRNGWSEKVLYNFANPGDGSFPISGLVRATDGTFYGTTAMGGIGSCNGGCGVVYKLAPYPGRHWKYTVMHKFNGVDGLLPDGHLILDPRGDLYGTALITVFEVTP
jgi:uncharacterized repeat protein (TIGR03803 family)